MRDNIDIQVIEIQTKVYNLAYGYNTDFYMQAEELRNMVNNLLGDIEKKYYLSE